MFKKIILFSLFCGVFAACQSEDTVVEYDPTPYQLSWGNWPDPGLPADNPLTIAGVELGRMLFYEKALSKDRSQSCADCHIQEDGFSDKRQFSIGVEELEGRRQAMPVMNLAWHYNGMFWDGRVALPRDQSLKPIQDPLEMNETLENAIAKLQDMKKYRNQFTRAFGNDSITALRMSLAMEQFMLTMISNNSKYDRFLRGEA